MVSLLSSITPNVLRSQYSHRCMKTTELKSTRTTEREIFVRPKYPETSFSDEASVLKKFTLWVTIIKLRLFQFLRSKPSFWSTHRKPPRNKFYTKFSLCQKGKHTNQFLFRLLRYIPKRRLLAKPFNQNSVKSRKNRHTLSVFTFIFISSP